MKSLCQQPPWLVSHSLSRSFKHLRMHKISTRQSSKHMERGRQRRPRGLEARAYCELHTSKQAPPLHQGQQYTVIFQRCSKSLCKVNMFSPSMQYLAVGLDCKMSAGLQNSIGVGGKHSAHRCIQAASLPVMLVQSSSKIGRYAGVNTRHDSPEQYLCGDTRLTRSWLRLGCHGKHSAHRCTRAADLPVMPGTG